MAPTLTPSRQTFRETLAQVAAQAKSILPEATNGRLEKAVEIVLRGDVLFCDDGRVEVGSCVDPLTMHKLVGTSCTCDDFQYNRAPGGMCKHKIAANLQKSVERVLARRGESDPVPGVPEGLEPWPDNDPELEPEPAPPAPRTPAPASSLPEAPASCNAFVMIGGHKVQITLRDIDEHRMLERLTTLLAQYPPAPDGRSQAQPQVQAPPVEEKRFCPRHGTEMQSNHKDGRSWWSHKTPDGWCKGR